MHALFLRAGDEKNVIVICTTRVYFLFSCIKIEEKQSIKKQNLFGIVTLDSDSIKVVSRQGDQVWKKLLF